MLRPRGAEVLSLLWRTLLQSNQMWRRVWRVWSSLPQHLPCCRQLCRVGLWDPHTRPSCRPWTQAVPCSNRTTLGGWILPGLPDQHQQRLGLQSCSAPESPHCCTTLALQALGARAGDMELPRCWVAPRMGSKRQRKCESGSRAEERENEHSAQVAVETELPPRAMKPFSLSHSKK